MRRAGREPAEDVKRRLIAACAEVGLEAKGSMTLVNDERFILITTRTVSLIARVPLSGNWPETIDVRCGTSENPFDPCVRGLTFTPFDQIVPVLRETLEQREQVVAAMRLGIDGPYRFERTLWQKPEFWNS